MGLTGANFKLRVVGLLTVDVNRFGVFVASDSQPVDMFAGKFEVHVGGAKEVSHVVRAQADGFSGLAGYVGTEVIDGRPAREWLRGALAARSSARLNDLCAGLAEELTNLWEGHESPTHLSIFVAGYELDVPCFWWVSNGEVPDGSTSIPLTFDAVNDLGGRYYERNARPGEALSELVARQQPSFRRGVLAAAAIFDSFTNVVAKAMAEHPQIPPIDSLDRYGAYVTFRFEFTKRMCDPKYGLGVDPHPPVAGKVHVYSIDPSGIARAHGKHVTDGRVVARPGKG